MIESVPLTDPTGAGALLAAANWVEALVTGTVATIVATIAVAGVGFLMLQGRMPLRRGVGVVLGCFVIFGAGLIANALMALATGDGGEMRAAPVPVSAPSTPVAPPPQPQVYDPYAGASVPVR